MGVISYIVFTISHQFSILFNENFISLLIFHVILLHFFSFFVCFPCHSMGNMHFSFSFVNFPWEACKLSFSHVIQWEVWILSFSHVIQWEFEKWEAGGDIRTGVRMDVRKFTPVSPAAQKEIIKKKRIRATRNS